MSSPDAAPVPTACPDAKLEHHLSSVSLSFNNIEYTVVARISFDFRKDSPSGEPELDHVLLTPLIAPESQSLASSIELRFRGRWRSACAFLRKRDIICVYCARVEPSADPEIHDAQLVLLDGPAATRGTRVRTSRPPPALFLLHPDARPRRATHVITAAHLAEGRLPCGSSAGAPPPPASPVPPGSPAPPEDPVTPDAPAPSTFARPAFVRPRGRPRKKRARTTPPPRTYAYRTIESLWQEAESLPTIDGGRRSSLGGTFNTYGVIIEARAASVTARTDLRSELILVDETSLRSTDALAQRRTLVAYWFSRDPRRALPFRAVGDIVRCHRLQLGRYTDGSGRVHVQGAAQSHSAFVLWAPDGEEPLTCLGPSGSHNDAIITEGDRARVEALQAFSRTFVAGMAPPPRSPFLRTVTDVLQAHRGAEMFAIPFDIVARFNPTEEPDGAPDALRFCVRDGREGAVGDATLRVKSVVSGDHLAKCNDYPFRHFAQSYDLGIAASKEGDAQWMVITDVLAAMSDDGTRALTMSVGKRTSTVLWLPPSAPQVRSHITAPVETEPEAQNAPSNAALQEVAALMEAEAAEAREAVRNALNTRWRSVGTHKGVHIPVVSVLSVLRAAERKEWTLARVRARVRSWVAPSDIRCVALPYCAACDEYRAAEGELCASCGDACGWGYLARLVLADDNGTWIYAWVEGEHATTFFGASKQSAVPCNVAKNRSAAAHIKKVSDALLRADTRLDCLVQPYGVTDDNGVVHFACRVLYTTVTVDEIDDA